MNTTHRPKPAHRKWRAFAAALALAIAAILTAGLGDAAIAVAKPPTSEDIARCDREKADYAAKWAAAWSLSNGRPAEEAPPPPIPYECGPVPDDPPTVVVPTGPEAPPVNIPDLLPGDGDGATPTTPIALHSSPFPFILPCRSSDVCPSVFDLVPAI